MIREIENRRSIRKYRSDEIDRKLIEEIIYSATLAPSAKNRQPWKFIVYQGEEKDKLVEVMRHGINSEKSHMNLCRNGHLQSPMLKYSQNHAGGAVPYSSA